MGNRLMLLGVLLAVSFCCFNADPQAEWSAFVSGKSNCIDCANMNIETELAYKGLHVAIKCKSGKGGYEVKGTGDIDKNGDYKVRLPAELIGDDGDLKQECFAQLHDASNASCPDENGLNQTKITLNLLEDGVHTFSTAAELPFSPATCASAFYIPKPPYPWIRRWCPPICTTMTATVPENPPMEKTPTYKKPAHP